MSGAVREVDYGRDPEPHREQRERGIGQLGDDVEGEPSAEDGRDRIARDPESPGQVRLGAAQDNHADRHHGEGDQGSHARQVYEHPERYEPSERPDEDATIIVLRTGTREVGLILWKISGSIPSRPMAKRMRVCP